MAWQLTTENTSQPVDFSKLSSLNLFSTRGGRAPVSLAKVNPQALYSQTTKPDFSPLRIEKALIPSLTNLYLFNVPLEAASLEQVFNIQAVHRESYFVDYGAGQTFVVSSSAPVLTGVIPLNENSFSREGSNLTFAFPEEQLFTVESIESRGLYYSPGTTPPHNFSFDTRKLTLFTSPTCGPQPGDPVNLNISVGLSLAYASYTCYSFDLSAEVPAIDFVDSLTHNNQTFQVSPEVKENTLIFDRITRECLCISKKKV